MAVFIRQDEQRSKLQERLSAELQEKARAQSEPGELPDGVEDSQYIKGTKQTTSLLWAWLMIGLVAIGVTIWLVVLSATQQF